MYLDVCQTVQCERDAHCNVNVLADVNKVILFKFFHEFEHAGPGGAMLCFVFDRQPAPLVTPEIPSAVISFGNRDVLPQETKNAIMGKGWPLTGVGVAGPACNGANIPSFVLNLPANVLFVGAPPVPSPPPFQLDLYEVQLAVTGLSTQ